MKLFAVLWEEVTMQSSAGSYNTSMSKHGKKLVCRETPAVKSKSLETRSRVRREG